jgi:hypothetical protein
MLSLLPLAGCDHEHWLCCVWDTHGLLRQLPAQPILRCSQRDGVCDSCMCRLQQLLCAFLSDVWRPVLPDIQELCDPGAVLSVCCACCDGAGELQRHIWRMGHSVCGSQHRQHSLRSGILDPERQEAAACQQVCGWLRLACVMSAGTTATRL